MAYTVLIVDDATFMRTMLKDILSKNGLKIVGEASNGKEAVEKCNRLKPDLITMDITMPKMNGIEAVRKIKEKNPQAKIIMVSAMGQQKLIIESLEAGALDFITKPFQPNKVIKTVFKYLGKSKRGK